MAKFFVQFAYMLPTEQGADIKVKGLKAWEQLPAGYRLVTWPQMRRFVGIAFPKATNVVKAMVGDQPNPGYAWLLEHGNSVAEHVAKFDKQAEEAQLNRDARALVAALGAKGFTVKLS